MSVLKATSDKTQTTSNKMLAAVLAVSTLAAGMTANTGSAEAYWRRGWGYGPGIGLGIFGGLAAGALIAGAARPYPYPYYYGGPVYEYDDGPICHVERRRVYFGENTYRIRRVRVCE